MRRLHLASSLAISTIVIAATAAATMAEQSAVSVTDALPTPTATASPEVIVNGQNVPLKNGSASVALPGGHANVSSNGNGVSVNTDSSGPGSSSSVTTDSTGNLHVTINSNSTGGSNWSSTQFNSFSTNDSSSGGFSNTTIFSSGTSQIQVSQ